MKYETVRNPYWANAEHTKINCTVRFSHLSHEVDFTASSTDTEEHGRSIFRDIVSGKYGNITEYRGDTISDTDFSSDEIQDVSAIVALWPDIATFLEQANAENAGGTSRGMIMVWSSMLDRVLGEILSSYLIDKPESSKLVWEDSHSSLKQFSGRIKLCYALGLINSREKELCNSIKEVRNAAAHEWDVSFKNYGFTKETIKHLRKLYDAHHSKQILWRDNDLVYLVRFVYTASCAMLLMDLAKRKVEILGERRTERP